MEVLFTIIVVLTMILPSLVIGVDHLLSRHRDDVNLTVWELDDVQSSMRSNQ
jgi:hypothetical protein